VDWIWQETGHSIDYCLLILLLLGGRRKVSARDGKKKKSIRPIELTRLKIAGLQQFVENQKFFGGHRKLERTANSK